MSDTDVKNIEDDKKEKKDPETKILPPKKAATKNIEVKTAENEEKEAVSVKETKKETPIEETKPEIKENDKIDKIKNSEETKEVSKENESKKKEATKEVKTKINNKKKDEESEEEDEEEQEEEQEEKKGLLDQPLEVSGQRERKRVERFVADVIPSPREKFSIADGKGEKLGNIPTFEHALQRTKADDLKPLHKILFSRSGSSNEVKRNIRKFSGYNFTVDSNEYKSKKSQLLKLSAGLIKKLCGDLDVEKGGTKEDIVVRLMEFLLCPKINEKTKKKTETKPKTARKPKLAVKTKAKKRKTDSNEDTGEDEAVGTEEDAEEDEKDEKEELDEAESENEDVKSPAKKAKTVPAKKTPAKNKKSETKSEDDENNDEDVEETKNVKKVIKKPAARRTVSKKKTATESDGSEENEEPQPAKKSKNATNKKEVKTVPAKKLDAKKKIKKPVKKVNSATEESDGNTSEESKKEKNPPPNQEIELLVQKIVKGANLEEITMKEVIKEVNAHYPDFDLGDRKEFIKSTVKRIIS